MPHAATPHAPPHVTATRRQADRNRGTAAERGYGYRWQIESKRFLEQHPFCGYCQAAGRLRAAECVDHFTPHKGDKDLFWDVGNWRPSCIACNSAKGQRDPSKGTER